MYRRFHSCVDGTFLAFLIIRICPELTVPNLLLTLIALLAALVLPLEAADGRDAYLDHRRDSPVEAEPSAFALLLDDVGDRARGLRNRLLARSAFPRPGVQLHTLARVGNLERLPGSLEDRLLVSSASPADIATPGYLLRTGDELGTRGAVFMPIQSGFDLHLNHRNLRRDGGDLLVVVEISNPNNELVEVWLGGAIHSSSERRGRWDVFGGYGGPSAATAEAVLTRLERKGWDERVLHLHPGSKVRVVTRALPYGHELDGFYHIGAGAPVHIDVRALDPSGRRSDDGVAGGWASGVGCSPSGVYHGARWTSDGDILEIPRPNRGRAYTLGAGASLGQAPRGLQAYRDACQQLEGSQGVLHRLELPLYNPTSRVRVVQLLLSAPDDGRQQREDYRWNGPVLVNGRLERVRLERAGHAEVLGTWAVYPGELKTVSIELLIPASAEGASALEVRTLE